ncbi:XRE family transcriptional regulator [Tenacibaculum maritimum]|uniref:XRE family transcriptional regulator n=1 Tax=Tenacibaculum maritimum TaxID=107401 RepID=UPI002306FA73|nr:LexA family transcriptional regulator [Tenacibaculum maritimum]MDB0600508.1 LexA family transcriptional regulator [Tenacibaculum maritimum]MDB0610661.1 LexA family transcriptional regulator [Tenacibaculum maritimum]
MNRVKKNIKHLRKLKKLTQDQLANELKITRSKIGSYEEGRSEPSIEMLMLFSDYFNLPIDVLIKKDLTYATDFSFIDITDQRILFPITIKEEEDDFIEVVPVAASAGYLLGYDDPEYIEQLDRIKLPFLPTGKHRAFPIKGDSMLPLKDGAYVVAKFVEDFNEISNGTTYVVVTRNDGMTYKRVYNDVEKEGGFLLSPDNPNHQSYFVPVTEILEMWEFTCAINTQEYDEKELKISSIAMMLNGLGVELRELKKIV